MTIHKVLAIGVNALKNLVWAYRNGAGTKLDRTQHRNWIARYKDLITYHSDPGILQDKWVESVFKGKRGGFFVEVGAADGVGSSNCFMLEKKLGWKGICVEPNPEFFARLTRNRKAQCFQCPVSPEEREVQFRLAGYYGGIQDNLATWHEKDWQHGKLVTMKTRRLVDILDEAGAPSVIDYLSLDIEGGEQDIIASFPFDRYKVLTMTIERSDMALQSVVESKGFRVVDNPFSDPEVDWELHCIHESVTD